MLRFPTLAAAWIGLAACQDDTITRARPDSGVAGADGGIDQPLPLLPGMAFTYSAVLTYRGASLGMEKNSQYNLTVTIATVDDRGANGGSTLDFTAVGQNLVADDWDETTDFDSWVARLGPALATDRVDTAAVRETLESVPRIPPVPTPPKQLPRAGTFFLDMRRITEIRAEFAQTYTGLAPQVVDPERNAGRWLLAFSGADSSIYYYPERARTRQIRLEYDPDGYLVRLDETIGDASNPPSATCRLTLQSMSGP